MANELSINKNAKEVYEFYISVKPPKEFKNKTVLVLECENVKYIEDVNKYAKKLCVIDSTYNCLSGEVFENINKLVIQIKSFLKENGMTKFNCCIMNPPYNGNLHLQILEKVIPMADEVVNISPVRWLQDPLAKYKKNSDYIKYEESISKKIDSCEIIKSDIANKLFDISFGDLGIYKISKGGFNYNFAQNNSLVNKFISKNDITFMDVATKEGYRGKYKSNHFGIINSHYGDTSVWIKDSFELFTTKRETNTNKVLFFNNNEEVKNCFCFLNLNVMRYFAKIIRKNQRVPWQFVPYLDYSKPWTDKRFCEYFGITGYIDDGHAEPDSEWETILNTMKEYE